MEAASKFYEQNIQPGVVWKPLNNMCQHLCALHVYSWDPSRVIESHHICTMLPSGHHQCLIYDSDAPDARLIGIEYLISEEAFDGLPTEEKKYWHSHKYEIESGLLGIHQMQGVIGRPSDEAQLPLMLTLRKLYGKTIHTWAPDLHPDIPIGPPHLMMSITNDTQWKPEFVEKRDARYGYSTEENRKKRQAESEKDPFEPRKEADQWQMGSGIKFEPTSTPLKDLAKY